MLIGSSYVHFAYDASGSPIWMRYNGTRYYYETNLQGDVIAILDTNGNSVVQYTYDAWGKLLSTAGTLADTIGTINPLLYRGYIYDHDTGLYYLQSRYYNSTIGRFICADTFVSTGQDLLGNNMFAYCLNNPVNMADDTGYLPFFVVTGIAGALIGGIIGYATTGSWKGAVVGAAVGGVIGLAGGAATAKLLAGSAVAKTSAVIAGGKALLGITASGILSQADKIAQKVGSIYRSLTQGNFRYNLQKLTGCSGVGMQAHHVFPQKFINSFSKLGINIHNPLYGSWVESNHQKWSAAYNKAWETFFNTVKNPTAQQVFDKLAELAKQFGFTLNF
jgi:RHS repeat-associated protein